MSTCHCRTEKIDSNTVRHHDEELILFGELVSAQS